MEADELRSHMASVIAAFGFDTPGAVASLGADMVRAGAEGIIDRTVSRQTDATGARLKPNEPRYAAKKAEEYGTSDPLRRTGQLLSEESVIGTPQVARDEVAWRYGTGQAPASGSASDREATDTEKAGFVSGERPFFGLDDPTCDRMAEVAADALEKHLEATK